jgi:hypothetical protein
LIAGEEAMEDPNADTGVVVAEGDNGGGAPPDDYPIVLMPSRVAAAIPRRAVTKSTSREE